MVDWLRCPTCYVKSRENQQATQSSGVVSHHHSHQQHLHLQSLVLFSNTQIKTNGQKNIILHSNSQVSQSQKTLHSRLGFIFQNCQGSRVLIVSRAGWQGFIKGPINDGVFLDCVVYSEHHNESYQKKNLTYNISVYNHRKSNFLQRLFQLFLGHQVWCQTALRQPGITAKPRHISQGFLKEI